MRDESTICTVYGLRSSADRQIRYVGQTVRRPEARLSNHISRASCGARGHRHAWIRQVLRDGFAVEIVTLQSDARWNIDEPRWIERLRSEGCDLVNVAPGGDSGALGMKRSEDQKATLRTLAQKLWQSEEYRAKVAAGHQRHWTPERRAEQSRRAATQTPSQSQREAASARLTRLWGDPEWAERRRANLAIPAVEERRLSRVREVCRTDEYRRTMSAASLAAWARRKRAANAHP